MLASDVYTIAKALPEEEFIKLSDMLRKDTIKKGKLPKKKNSLPDFTPKDALRYLLENHIQKT